MPQMMRAIIIRNNCPFPNASMEPRRPAQRIYTEVKLVAPQNLTTLEMIIAEFNNVTDNCQVLVSFDSLLHHVCFASLFFAWDNFELPRNVTNKGGLRAEHFARFKAAVGSGLKCPGGRCHGGLGARKSLLELKSGAFVYFMCALKVTGLPRAMGQRRIWAYCKRLAPMDGDDWIDAHLQLPVMRDALARDVQSSYMLVRPEDIVKVYSLVPVRQPHNTARDPQVFYGLQNENCP
jgi:hypothetical protein